MYFERLLVGNVRYLGNSAHDFAIGPGHLRRWNLFPAGSSSSALLRALALAGLGQRQLERLAQRSPLSLAERVDQPVHLEFVQVRHALQEREATSPVRRHLGWWGGEGGQFSALPKSAMRQRDPAARAGRPDLGRSNVGRLLLGYATWRTAEGLEYAGQPGVEPTRLPGDHFGEPAMYPALLADEINLDSPQEQKEMMLRAVKALRTAGVASETTLLLGVAPDTTTGRRRTSDDAEALCNSRSGRIHLFPVSPSADVVAFRNFQARGGFLVTACKNAGRVYHVEIQSRRDNPCRVMNPWPGKPVIVHEAGRMEHVPIQVDKSNGECVVFATRAGHTYSLEQTGG
jgi:hypothetical protein